MYSGPSVRGGKSSGHLRESLEEGWRRIHQERGIRLGLEQGASLPVDTVSRGRPRTERGAESGVEPHTLPWGMLGVTAEADGTHGQA